MPSDEALLQQAEEFKAKGNEAFQKGAVEEAIQAYSHGIVACDRLASPPTTTATTATTATTTTTALKATLLSNRAMCFLKAMMFQPCIDDCSNALNLNPPDEKLRAKVLFRRAKARFLMSNMGDKKNDTNLLLQDSAKDLLQLLQIDPNNSEANQLLVAVRAQHHQKQGQTAATPVSKVVSALRNRTDSNHNVKMLLGMIDNDLMNTSMEMGRLGAVSVLFEVANESSSGTKTAVLAVQCISQAAGHAAFVRAYLGDSQKDVLTLVESQQDPDVIVSALAVLVRIILHLDRDDPDKDISGKTGLDYQVIIQTCTAALRRNDKTVTRGVLDLLTSWTAGKDRDSSIRAALGHLVDPLLPMPKTQTDIRAMTPQQLAAHRKRELDKKTRDEAWAFERGILFVQIGLKPLLQVATSTDDHVLRREIIVVISRILAGIESEDKIKEVTKPLFGEKRELGVVIEEVYNDDGDEKDENDEVETNSIESMMESAIITNALLLSKADVGAWALGSGWSNSVSDMEDMIRSGDKRAMCLASEVMSAAATLESARHIITNMMKSGMMEKLILSDDRDIRSGAASAVAKVGMADKSTGTDEAEIIGLLQGACDLLEDKGENESNDAKKGTAKLHHFSSFASSSVERAIEMLTYLVAHTVVKEELAAGFQAPGASQTALARLVEVSNLPNAGESLSGFGLATIFQHLAVTNGQLRKEMFEGKEVTMEQYDEMQRMGKTEEEKERLDSQADTDTQDACNERIRKMASAGVPRAMVTLMEGASEHTLDQLAMAMSRMAVEPAVRGIMIQHGVLTACIKVEKNEGPTETDTMKKVIRTARHCIAKMLISTNPSLLTSAQRLGSVRPLLLLIRDIKASDLQHFEGLLAITNIASSGEDAKERIVNDKGIAPLHFAMFDSHEMVQRAATEALCNLVPHKAMMDHLTDAENLKLWLAFASDYEEHYECARAAAGCLAMATQDESVALELCNAETYGNRMASMLESGRLEIMHRALYIVLNMLTHGGECKEKTIAERLPAFCEAFVENYRNTNDLQGLEFPPEERALLPVTVDLAKKIVSSLAD